MYELTNLQKEEFMNIALLQAKKAKKCGEVPIGAIVVDANGKILSKAFNKRIKMHDATAHAEVLAIKKAGRKLKDFRLCGCVMFVTMQPCPMCCGAISNSRIEKVFYGASSDRLEEEIMEKIFNSKTLNHNVEFEGGILENECGMLVKNFFKKRREEKQNGRN